MIVGSAINRLIHLKCRVAGIYHRLFPISNHQLICRRPFGHLVLGNRMATVCFYLQESILDGRQSDMEELREK